MHIRGHGMEFSVVTCNIGVGEHSLVCPDGNSVGPVTIING